MKSPRYRAIAKASNSKAVSTKIGFLITINMGKGQHVKDVPKVLNSILGPNKYKYTITVTPLRRQILANVILDEYVQYLPIMPWDVLFKLNADGKFRRVSEVGQHPISFQAAPSSQQTMPESVSEGLRQTAGTSDK